jgi:hypothetical protein
VRALLAWAMAFAPFDDLERQTNHVKHKIVTSITAVKTIKYSVEKWWKK